VLDVTAGESVPESRRSAFAAGTSDAKRTGRSGVGIGIVWLPRGGSGAGPTAGPPAVKISSQMARALPDAYGSSARPSSRTDANRSHGSGFMARATTRSRPSGRSGRRARSGTGVSVTMACSTAKRLSPSKGFWLVRHL